MAKKTDPRKKSSVSKSKAKKVKTASKTTKKPVAKKAEGKIVKKEKLPVPWLLKNTCQPVDKKFLKKKEVPLPKLFATYDESKLKFKTTEDIKPSNKIIDQQRAVRAIHFGLGIEKPGFNIYVAGMEGTGKTSVIKSFLQNIANKKQPANDWCYVHNFEVPEQPIAITLPPGQGKILRKEMEDLVEQLMIEIPEAFQSEEYENNINSRMNYYSEKKSKLYDELDKIAKKKSFSLKSSRMGIITIPMKRGKTLNEKEYNALPEKERHKIEKKRTELEPKVLEFARSIRALDQEAKETVAEIQNALGDYLINLAMEDLFKKYKNHDSVMEYLNHVKENLLHSILEYIEDSEEKEKDNGEIRTREGKPFMEYEVNVFVDNSKLNGAPVVIENNPTYYNLFGKVEKKIEYGIYVTGLASIKSGSIHRANGGYLVINAIDVFKMPMVWETLKRILRNQMAFIEDIGEGHGLLPTSGVTPEPIPLEIKLILIGSDEIYHLLYSYDEEFKKIFKIKSDFDYQMPRNQRTVQGYVSFIATRSHVENLKHFNRSGVAAIIEYSSRLVESQKHLSSSFGEVKDIIIESNFIATEQKSKYINREHVEKAVNERKHRSDLIYNHYVNNIIENQILIDSTQKVIGQANGLAVYMLGDTTFGRPNRITSKVFKGKTGVINIERESDMSGQTHTKGVLILSSLIRAKFARRFPLSLSATICFEQSYSDIDGDSASSTEYYTIISALSEIPIKQSLSITGSINQKGEIQPIGGVNEKIEGFFEICNKRGLTGEQGVIIPIQNVTNLMLNNEIRDAAKKGMFHIYAIKSVEEGLELLMGYSAGKIERDGLYTKNSIYRAVEDKLEAYFKYDKAEGSDD